MATVVLLGVLLMIGHHGNVGNERGLWAMIVVLKSDVVVVTSPCCEGSSDYMIV